MDDVHPIYIDFYQSINQAINGFEGGHSALNTREVNARSAYGDPLGLLRRDFDWCDGARKFFTSCSHLKSCRDNRDPSLAWGK